MPVTPHHRDEVPLFDVVMESIVPTYSTLAVEPPTPMEAWEAAGCPCDECGAPMRPTRTDEGPGFSCSCGFAFV